MGKRRLQMVTSDDEDEPNPEEKGRKQRRLRDVEERDESVGGYESDEAAEEEEEAPLEDAKPVGEVTRTSGKGKKMKKHYESFEYDGNVFHIEDSVLLTPEDKSQKPYVAIIKDGERIVWPDSAVPAITALEKASHETLGDFQKYNQKMRQMVFNLKNKLLARRLLKKELDPVVVLNMTPNELKDGLTAAEKSTKEPEDIKRMQMTDARCSRCTEKKVGVADIIHAGGHGDRYQLECMACGHAWYASRDAISSLTIDVTSSAINVGTAPWATAKFENIEKKLVSPRETSDKQEVDIFQKSAAAHLPVLETQKSLNRSKANDSAVPPTNRE